MRIPNFLNYRWVLVIGLLADAQAFCAENGAPASVLAKNQFRSGEETLRAFAPVSKVTRDSIVKFNVDGSTVALGAVVDAKGLVLTKASELKPGKLTCWLAAGNEVSAELIRSDEVDDVALVRVNALGLKPIEWATEPVVAGQWAITPGIAETPHAVGIISALSRRIRPQRAYIGVQFDFSTLTPKVEEVVPGLGAEKAGLKAGDVILAVGGTSVTTREQVVEILRELRDGQNIKLGVRRADEKFEADVALMLPRAGRLGRGFDREGRMSRMGGQVSSRSAGFEQAIEHDTVLQPWLCGGPLVNLEGKAVGLNIARAGRVSTYALPARLVKQIVARFNIEGLKQ